MPLNPSASAPFLTPKLSQNSPANLIQIPNHGLRIPHLCHPSLPV